MTSIVEALIHLGKSVVCPLCKGEATYVDKLSDGTLCCISCSHIQGIPSGEDVVLHEVPFSPEDPMFRREMFRVSSHDVCSPHLSASVKLRLSKGVVEEVERLSKEDGFSPSVEVETALSWYISMRARLDTAGETAQMLGALSVEERSQLQSHLTHLRTSSGRTGGLGSASS